MSRRAKSSDALLTALLGAVVYAAFFILKALWEFIVAVFRASTSRESAPEPRASLPKLWNGRSPRVPKDPDLMEALRGQDVAVVHRQYVIDYSDAGGKHSTRRISVRGVQAREDADTYLISWCHERDDVRHFVASRISNLVDADTGEIIADPVAHFQALYQADSKVAAWAADYAKKNARVVALRRFEDAVLVLVYVARADGRMIEKERQPILGFVAFAAQALSLPPGMEWMPERKIKQLSCDHEEFLRAAHNLASLDATAKSELLQAAQAVMDADGAQKEGELKALHWLEHKLQTP